MSSHYKLDTNVQEIKSQSKVKLTDLLTRINEEKKIELNLFLTFKTYTIKYASINAIITPLEPEIIRPVKLVKIQA